MKIVEDDPSSQVGESTDSVLIGADEDFVNILDVPFITMNRINGKYVAEVVISGVPEMDRELIEAALSAGRDLGVHAWARVLGDANGGKRVTIYFTPDDPEQ